MTPPGSLLASNPPAPESSKSPTSISRFWRPAAVPIIPSSFLAGLSVMTLASACSLVSYGPRLEVRIQPFPSRCLSQPSLISTLSHWETRVFGNGNHSSSFLLRGRQ
ncbi:uncharacterized protein LY79DRAFT_544955 [Colletotrichum navitas]|uniref:Uncharacterized protein n=1 Tax=Colletotrichum navitas TaxID=681940 RepID=A0AAD8Q7F8_9PEZI|nr:uncharacterized protein LY79DRAFT_544955 [Colletotrichum navitas]KAK1595979.1 hypothetical protein LY79DRAFT_544955 [Colletotrichum navitas]